MEAGIYNLETTVKGDTLNEFSFTMLNGTTPINLTGYTIRMQIRNSYNSIAVKTFAIGSGITVVNPSSGVFKVNSFIVDIAAGQYVYDIEFTSTSGVKKTYIAGELTVLNDVTR